MTITRTIAHSPAPSIVPAEFNLGNASDSSATVSPFGALIDEFRLMTARRNRLFADRNRIEAVASSRKIKFRDCAELAVVEENELAWYKAENTLIQRAARTRAATVDEVMLKLILWRLIDFDRGGFNNPIDMVAFSAYRDLLFLTGWASMTPKADANSHAIILNDQAFQEDEKDEYDNANDAD